MRIFYHDWTVLEFFPWIIFTFVCELFIIWRKFDIDKSYKFWELTLWVYKKSSSDAPNPLNSLNKSLSEANNPIQQHLNAGLDWCLEQYILKNPWFRTIKLIWFLNSALKHLIQKFGWVQKPYWKTNVSRTVSNPKIFKIPSSRKLPPKLENN